MFPASIALITDKEEYIKFAATLGACACTGSDFQYPPKGCACTISESGVVVVVLGDTSKQGLADICSTFAHECVHVKQSVLNYMEEDNPGIELEAYMVGYYMRWFMKEYTRQMKVKNATKPDGNIP